jgi:L-fuconolactonase
LIDLDRFEWLSRQTEVAIEPELEIVDAHHHFWDRGGSTYLAEQLAHDVTSGHRVTQTIFVECMSKYDRMAPPHLRPVGETRFVASQADTFATLGDTRVSAIIGFADLTLGRQLDETLDSHLGASALFRGVRHATGWDASDVVGNAHHQPTQGLTSAIQFIDGAKRLSSRGLTLDVWLYHPQLLELETLARQVPDLNIVINHLGAPLGIGPYAGKPDDVRSQWRSNLKKVAELPNIFLKLGGFGLDEKFGLGWTMLDDPPSSDTVALRWGDDVRWCIETFGPQRCMFESNFPVDRQSLTYVVLWNACKKMTGSFSPSERAALFAGTARRAYSLTPCP